jgi:hypothetical protein
MTRLAIAVVVLAATLSTGCFDDGGVAGLAPPPTVVPYMKHGYVDEALAEARAGGFRFSITVANPGLLRNLGSGFNGFVVIRQRPLAGATAPRGTVLHLVLGESFNGGFDQADPPGVVPDLVGAPVGAALHGAYSSGLRVTLAFAPMPLTGLRVTGQSVAPGVRVSHGHVITLRIG